VEFAQPLTEIIVRSKKVFLGSRAQPLRKADNLAAISVPIV
jgi:hypothetical protein